MRNLLIVVTLVCGIAVEAQSAYIRFLIPFYTPDLAGANGSIWNVDTWVRYSGTEGAQIVPRPVCRPILCPLGIVFEPGLPPVPVEPIAGLSESGVLVHVDSRYAAAMTFASRIRDLSRQDDTAGTEVPVVREDRITNVPLHLLNVPVDSRFRTMLRIYALPETAAPTVEVRYYRLPDPNGTLGDLRVERLRTERVSLRTHSPVQGFFLQPSFAQLAYVGAYPELAGEDAIWIEVVPIGDTRVWAFVSVTNNDTQQVTLITPDGR